MPQKKKENGVCVRAHVCVCVCVFVCEIVTVLLLYKIRFDY